jgi:hypothetical protein
MVCLRARVWCQCRQMCHYSTVIYGLKSAGTSFQNHLADCMWHLGLESYIADQDLWMKAEIRPNNGHK